MTPLYCPWESAEFILLSSNVPLLIHYSHFIAIFAAMAVSMLVFFNNPRSIISRLFLVFSSLFSTWALLDIVLWATNDPSIVMFSWAVQVLLEPLTMAVAFYLFYLFIYRHLPPFWTHLSIGVLLLPLIIFLPTTLNLEALQLSSCESIEGPIAQYYSYLLNLAFIFAIVFIGVRKIPHLETMRRRTAALFGIGLVTFLLSFTSGNILGSFTDDWTLSQYGLFGMPIFAFLIAYSIVQFKAFQVQVAGAQVLVVILWALVASLVLVDTELIKLIAGVTLVFTTIAGFLLVTSVKKEFRQRLELESLTKQLARANTRLKQLDKLKSEFVSIASHQLRSPLTAIRGYASMLVEGSFGKVPEKAKEPLQRIEQSAYNMALSVEDYLNVSRIESGNMKFECSDFNLKELAEQIVDDLRQQAMKKGLLLTFKSDMDGKGLVNADQGKTTQILHNLINNSLKYTPKGSITVFVHDDSATKQIHVEVIDTGIGMDPDTIEHLFDKFERAKDANKVNTEGTGLGLFVARAMARAMKGDVTAHSEGEGKGSHFILTLPLQM